MSRRFVEICSPWLTLIGEHLEGDRGELLDYWRVEKADSVVILTVQAHQWLLPKPVYRPGVGEETLDFPGGRIPSDATALAVAPAILRRELELPETAILHLELLNQTGWAINSSFSNQRLYGVIAEIDPQFAVNPQQLGATYPATQAGLEDLLKVLTCLQCRAVLQEWRSRHSDAGLRF
jgi:hypothetical protein